MSRDVFSQRGYRCRLEWGRDGTQRAAERGDILVIVDVLSFSTTVVTAIENGARIYPCAAHVDVAEVVSRTGAVVAVNRSDVPSVGRFSLSPLTFVDVEAGTRVVLSSPNGATCSRYGSAVPHLFVAALLNARAVASAVTRLLDTCELDVTVVACGERWHAGSSDGEEVRFAIEDYLGAGAVLSDIGHLKSPEATLCALAFNAARGQLPEMIHECGSGRELRENGSDADVEHAAQLNLFDVVPVMRNGWLERM